jgi:cytosine/adenosine deaminase-related metal-dependent hydrolase
MHAGLETLLGGATAILDHLWVRHIEDVEAAVAAYKALGIRVWLALMLGDTAGDNYANYTACAPNAADRNAAAHAAGGCACGGMAPGGALRLGPGGYDPAKTDAAVALWEEAIARFHRPEEGINIAIGPVTCYSASRELITRGAALRAKHGLCGHIHLLETQGQALQSRQYFGKDGAVGMLRDTGFLALPGTSCAHAVWLDAAEIGMLAEAGASIVHNPASNLRLGSGVAPLPEYIAAGVNVALGADGACSSDGQDMHEVMKLTAILHTLRTREYRDWLEPRDVLRMATAGGYAAVNMKGASGVLAVGAAADVVLYDLLALSMLPRADPIGTLVLGRPSAGAACGDALHSMWVRGRRVNAAGAPATVDVGKLRADLAATYPCIRRRAATDPRAHPYTAAVEVEYRAAAGLEGTTRAQGGSEQVAFLAEGYPAQRTLDDRTSLP